ncbi:DUF4245 domain-containing protein [Spongiactinospora sp. TRM90649]|uniref:DUF4245 domain-containing protein n=1 Tax=Spongiactinospora sp. TRM90649 TaxID=3031114 RepID=UPI0023F95887|nr:DUF4245 domain-containing protein [Spongiactinospora sp. TRM90649]MDF5754715.1 DUF4245 domain-containing protein [Spongiactinospora sp. TRM90649]
MQRFAQGFYGYVFALLVCFGLVGVFLLVTPVGRSEHIPSVDYSIDLANARRSAAYQVWAPPAPPKDWIPTSSRMVADDGSGTVTWRLGFATAARSHAMLAQSDEKPQATFAGRMAGIEKSQGTQRIGDVTWERRFRPDKKQRSLVRVLPEATIVITGTADWPELAALAAALKPQSSA